MAVSNYIPYGCQYKIDKLDNVVYIVAKNEIGSIRIDNGDAYVDGVGYYNAIDCLSVSLSENESLDERYEFVHTVNFSVRGYLKIGDLNDYYIMVRDKNDTYWLVNPYFKIKYTYTYTLDYNSNHTDYVASAKSNFPLLQVKNFTANNVKPCNAYDYCSIDVLAINVAAYSKYSNDKVIYTNDGFSVVKYQKNSCVFTEQYDGSSLSHTVKFNISFDDYKSSWHYNLLEFTDNKYAAVISTKCGVNIACGFDDGLQPSYTVTANDNQSINNIEIVLSDIHSTEVLLNMPSELPFEHDSGTTWNVIPSEYTCINSTTGVYTLRQEYDVFGNPLNNYMCLEGFEERYSEYHIVGTFSDQEQFYCPKCKAEECSIQTSMPNVIEFYNTGCKSFTIKSNSDFSITSDSQYIAVSPSSGSAYTLYTINVCNTQVPTDTAQAYQLVVNYCDGHEKRFNVRVSEEPVTDCLPQGNNYEISVYAQNVVIPTTCCIRDVSASCCCTDFQIQNGFVKFRVENNDSGVERTITLTLTKCDGTTVTAYLHQKPYYTKWVYQGEQCHDDEWCSWDRMYSGETSDNINTPTSVVRYRNCEPSSKCSQAQYKWENMNPQTDFICSDCGAQYKWENMNPQTDYICNDCQVEPQYRWVNLDPAVDYYCSGTTKYYKQQLQISVDGGVTWENISPAEYQRGGIAQTQSTDCGYVPTVQYRWIQTDNTICVEQSSFLGKFKATYNDGRTYSAGCTSQNETLAQGDVRLIDYRYTAMTEAIIGDCVTTIGTGAFDDCDSLTSATIGNSVRSIDSSAFAYCDILPSITIPNSVTSIGNAAFYHCPSLTSITIPNSVTNIGSHAFHDCRSLASVTIGSGVTSIGDNNFSTCPSLTSITISNSVTRILHEAFAGCTSLPSITIPNSVTRIGEFAFSNCTSLTSVTIGSGVTTIDKDAFYGCTSLPSITIPNSVTNIGNDAFGHCTSLTSVTIGSGVTYIESWAFSMCSGLTSITCNAVTPPTLGSNVFNKTNNCPIYVPSESVNAYKTASGWSTYANRIQPIP